MEDGDLARAKETLRDYDTAQSISTVVDVRQSQWEYLHVRMRMYIRRTTSITNDVCIAFLDSEFCVYTG